MMRRSNVKSDTVEKVRRALARSTRIFVEGEIVTAQTFLHAVRVQLRLADLAHVDTLLAKAWAAHEEAVAKLNDPSLRGLDSPDKLHEALQVLAEDIRRVEVERNEARGDTDSV